MPRILVSLLLALLAAGCSTESAEIFFSRPDQFYYLSCEEIAAATTATQTREAELEILIDRAEKGALGSFISATAYQSDYLRAKGDLKLLAVAAQNKKCKAGTPAPESQR